MTGPVVMNGYLGHIANVAFNKVPLVQPRLASRFEGSTGAAPAEEYREAAARPSATPAVEPVATTPIARLQQQTPELPEAPRQPDISTREFLEPPAAQNLAARFEQTPARAPAPRETHTEIQQLIREQIREVPLLVPLALTMPDRAPETAAPARNPVVTIEHIQHLHSEPAAHALEPVATTKSPAPASRTAPVDGRPLQVQTRMPAPEGQREPAAQYQAESHQAAAPAPSIQVSIGRIEIRANTASSSPAAKPKSAPATLSLDDYLKQRKGDR